MSYFVVAGMPACCMFNHVRVIADILSDRLPNFQVNIIQLEPLKWKTWIKEINLKNNWYHLSSPIVWKELSMRGGKPHLIGGASEFWEYCYDYYNLESLLPNKELYKIVADFKQYNESRREKEQYVVAKKQKFIICILSTAKDNTIILLLLRLIHNRQKFAPSELIIKVFKQDMDDDDLEDAQVFGAKIQIVNNLNKGLDNTDLLILTGDYRRTLEENLYEWLFRCKIEMEAISDYINDSAKPSLRVIVAINGPACFCTAILIENATKISLHNIVAETSSLGLEPLSLLSQLTQMPLNDLSGPPVWGFPDLSKIIDLEHIVQRYDVYRPNMRAVKNSYSSTLQLGTIHTELRYMTYLSDKFKTLWSKLYKKDSPQINRYSKVRGILSLVKNWFFPEYSGNIISLGILSTGAFGIPAGIVFSQPVILQNDRWVPFKSFPVPRKDPCDIKDLIPFVLDIYKYFKIREDLQYIYI